MEYQRHRRCAQSAPLFRQPLNPRHHQYALGYLRLHQLCDHQNVPIPLSYSRPRQEAVLISHHLHPKLHQLAGVLHNSVSLPLEQRLINLNPLDLYPYVLDWQRARLHHEFHQKLLARLTQLHAQRRCFYCVLLDHQGMPYLHLHQLQI